MQTLLHIGQAKVWAEYDWDAARSFSLLLLSFADSRLFAPNLRLALLTDERQLSRSKASCYVQAVSSAGLCNASLERHDHAFVLGAR